jgi:hypothetical protein
MLRTGRSEGAGAINLRQLSVVVHDGQSSGQIPIGIMVLKTLQRALETMSGDDILNRPVAGRRSSRAILLVRPRRPYSTQIVPGTFA